MEITIPQWIVDIVLWLVHLFSPQELTAMVWIIIATLGLTHFAKIASRLFLPTRPGPYNTLLVHLFAGIIGTVAAFFIWPRGGVPWWIAGPVGAAGAIAAFKSFYPIMICLFPKLAAIVNVERRRGSSPIPLFDERRKS